MITDGSCSISHAFKEKLLEKKQILGFEIYTIICNYPIVKDNFSSEIFSI
jgi:hypothetical protein